MQSARTFVVASVASVVALVAGAQPAQAQDTGYWVTVDIVQVKAERLSDLIKLYRDEINSALRKAGVPWRSVWQTGEFGETTNFDDKQVFRGFPVGTLRRVERFTRVGPDQIDSRMDADGSGHVFGTLDGGRSR